MINKTTKIFILIMTSIIILTMIYILNVQSFLDVEDPHAPKEEISPAQKRIQELARQNMPSIGVKHAEQRKTVKIGISLPSLADDALGKSLKTSLYMALSEIPTNTKFKYELVIMDGYKKDKNLSHSNVQKLIAINKVNALLSVYSDDAKMVSNFAEETQVPHIACALGENFLSEYKYSFNNFPKTESLVSAFLESIDRKNIKIISIVSSDEENMIEIVEELEKQVVGFGVQIMSKYIISHEQKDFTNEVREIVRERPELIFVNLPYEKINIFATALNNTNLNFRYGGVEYFKSFNNRFLIDGAIFVGSSNGGEEFQQRFRQKTILPIYDCVPQLYDSLKMLVLAFESVDYDLAPKGEVVISNLTRIKDFPSATGGKISVFSKGRHFDSKVVEYEILNGKLFY